MVHGTNEAGSPLPRDATAGPGEGRRQGSPLIWWLLLAALMSGIALTTATFIAQDNSPLYGDAVSNLIPSVYLRQAVETLRFDDLAKWAEVTGGRPPLASVAYLPAMFLVEDQVVAIRITELVLFLLVLLLIYRLGRRLAGVAAGFLAAYLFGLFPYALGWSRMANADPLIWAATLLVFTILLQWDPRRISHAVVLGFGLGLCLGTRLLCVPYLVGPALFVLATVRWGRRTMLHLSLTVVCALLVPGWWYLLKLRGIVESAKQATGLAADSMGHHPEVYLGTGMEWFIAAGILAGAVAARRQLLDRKSLVLFALWIIIPAAQFLFLWDSWERYLLPLLPQCALLVAVVLEHLIRSQPALPRLLVRGAVMALGILPMALLVGEGMSAEVGRFHADPSPFNGLAQVLKRLPAGEPALTISEVHDDQFLLGRNLTLRHQRVKMGAPPGIASVFELEQGRKARFLVLAAPYCPEPGHLACGQPRDPGRWYGLREQLKLERIAVADDSDGVRYSLFRLDRPLGNRRGVRRDE